ncbi:MAG: hypothetical protein SFX73_29270 [Kofleriaceae bacterium]|nr:hypothetical protein [Kofleriaceae bacterium]
MAAFRDDLEALTARHATLEAELSAKTREVAEAARMLEDMKVRRTLPVLPNIRVASPCSADWSKMSGDARVRACGDCKKNVYNLSEMTREEAEALIVEKEGKLCVRYFQRNDGTILLKDCAIGVRRRHRRILIAAGAVSLIAGTGVAAALLATDCSKSRVEVKGEMIQGEMIQGEEIQGEMIRGEISDAIERKGPKAPRLEDHQRIISGGEYVTGDHK